MSEDELSTCIKAIEEELESLTPIPVQRCMYKVHEQLRKVNEEAYKPVLLAIGPYYERGTIGQGFMEEHKLRYLQQMLARTNGDVKTYMTALMELEGISRKCYVECTSQISPHEFAKMMLLDGCFIIELFRKYETYRVSGINTLNDPIFKMEWVLPRIARDLLLFENQLPFFVLVKLFRMRESRNSGTSTDPSICKLSHLALQFFHSYLPFKWNAKASNYNSKEKIGDLVCLMHEALVDKALIPSLPKMVWKRLEAGFRFKNARFEHLLGLIYATISISILDPEINEAKVELKKAGIFEHLFVLISKAVIPLHAERKDMSNQEPFLRPEGLEGDSEENMEVETDQGWESIDQFCSELKEAGITFKMAKKFKDHVNEIQAWEKESIPHAFELQEARIEFNEAKTFKNLLNRIHPAEDQNSRLYSELLSQAGVEPKKAKTFVSLLEIEDVNIHGATELQEAGIKLRKSENDNMFSIKFNNGLIPLMEVSPLSIEDQTETCLRNLIAYEQYCDMDKSLNYVTNYVLFMDSLINSSKDVELLRQRGIIQNYLGDDVAISTMVNKLCDNINLSNYNIYSRTSRNLNMHCRGFWNKQMAKLKRDYFSSPWAWISFLAGVLLLVLTIVQTIFSIIP